MATKNNTPYQNILALSYLNKKGLIGKVKSFEESADIDALELGKIKIPWQKGRRWDVMIDPDKMLEVKGAKGFEQKVDGRFQREFKNDLLHNLFRINTPPKDFQWLVKSEAGKLRYKKAMEKVLGKPGKGSDILGSMDPAFKSVMKKMEKKDPDRYDLAIVRLNALRGKANRDKLVLIGD